MFSVDDEWHKYPDDPPKKSQQAWILTSDGYALVDYFCAGLCGGNFLSVSKSIITHWKNFNRTKPLQDLIHKVDRSKLKLP